jgi:DNA-binding transcriptional regulator YiaG
MIRNDTVNHLNPTNTMSSKIRIVKICEYCKNEFVARTTVTNCCSDTCAKRFYKVKIKNDKIAHAELKTEIRRQPKNFITEDQIKVINSKQCLTLKEAAFILNISPLTLRRWTLTGKMSSKKIGKKHSYMRKDLF